MAGVITSLPPPIEPPPSNIAGNPEVLGPLSYVPAVPNLPQTWIAVQTYTAGNLVLSGTGGTSQVLQQTTLNGAVTVGQLSFSNIAGVAAAAQLPAPTASTLGGIESYAAVSHQWINAISTSGVPSSTQPTLGDLTTQAAYTIVGNFTGSSAAPTASTIGSLTQKSPAAPTDLMLIQDQAASGQLKYSTIGAAISGAVRSYLAGLTLSTAGSSATFSVAAGVASDSTNVSVMGLSAISKTTSAWAVGSGNGALDTGAIAASTWYHVYVIQRTDTQVVDVLVSLSASAPTMPASYTLSRRIGAMKTNGSSQWTLFHQLGDEFLWDTPFGDVNTTTLSTTATLYTLSVPPGVQVNVRCRGAANNATAGTLLLVNSPDEAVAATNSPTGNYSALIPAAGVGIHMGELNIRTNTSGQIRAVASAASSTLIIATYGWIDRRGRDS